MHPKSDSQLLFAEYGVVILAMFSPLHSVTNEEQCRHVSCNQFSCYGKYGCFHCKSREAITCYHESIPCAVSKKKGGKERLVHDACMVLNWGMPKDTCWAEVTSSSEKFKPVVLAVFELNLSDSRKFY